MVQRKQCINVFSDLNPWIDFCIMLETDADYAKAEQIVDKAFSDYEQLDEACGYTVIDWVSKMLSESNIKYKVYNTIEQE